MSPSPTISHGRLRRRWRAAPAQVWCAPDAVEAMEDRFPDRARTTIVVDEEMPAGTFRLVCFERMQGAGPASYVC